MSAINHDAYPTPKVALSPDHQNLCVKTLKFLHDLGPEIEKVAAAGIDVTTWEQLRQRLIDVNQSIAKNFCSGVVNHPPA